MIKVKNIYDAVLFKVAEEENGRLSTKGYNVLSREAELRFIDYLSGDVEGIKPPEPYRTQKNKDWLHPVYSFDSQNIGQEGLFKIPDDYYGYENMFYLGAAAQADCESDETQVSDGCGVPIELLQPQQFYSRCTTYIKGLRPSPTAPIAKQTGLGFEILPRDLGSVKLEYYRYPKFAELRTGIDLVYNNEVVDEAASTNYEWDSAAEPLLTWLIIQGYIYHNRERALLETNETVGKSIRK